MTEEGKERHEEQETARAMQIAAPQRRTSSVLMGEEETWQRKLERREERDFRRERFLS
jgi:hypothetical protein